MQVPQRIPQVGALQGRRSPGTGCVLFCTGINRLGLSRLMLLFKASDPCDSVPSSSTTVSTTPHSVCQYTPSLQIMTACEVTHPAARCPCCPPRQAPHQRRAARRPPASPARRQACWQSCARPSPSAHRRHSTHQFAAALVSLCAKDSNPNMMTVMGHKCSVKRV